jgi:hypothetical protein
VTGIVWTGAAGRAGTVGVEPPAEIPPAEATPVAPAKPDVAETARNVKLHKNALLRVRTRKTTTSFVGLRG